MSLPKQKTVRIFGVGGFGINIAHNFDNDGGAHYGVNFDVSYFDTSMSNFVEGTEERFYLVPGVDGAGKDRAKILEAVKPHILPYVKKFAPRDLNIVILSGGGGSGSTAGPLIINELLNRGQLVVALVLGDADSAKAADNSIKSMMTLSALAARQSLPITALYEDLQDLGSRRKADELFIEGVRSLAVLMGATGQPNSEIDMQDLTHWLHYNKATDFPVGLTLMNIYGSNEELESLEDTITAASLYASPDEAHGALSSAYRTTGYTSLVKTLPIHFTLTQAGLGTIMDTLKRRHEEHESAKLRVKKQHVQLHHASASDNDDILVL